MGETAIAPPMPEERPADSFFSRALGVFISPASTFESIARRPDFIAPLVTVIVAGIVVTETMLAKIGMERIVRQSIEASSRGSQMSPDQLQQAAHQGAVFGGILARVAEVLGAPIYLLIVAAVGLFIINVVFGAASKFKVDFSVVCYAYLVSLVGSLLALVVILFGDPEQFNAQDFIPSNLGFFLNQHETPRPLYAIASSFDVFTAWFLFLAAIGLSAASAKKAKPLPIFLIFFGLWAVWVFAKAGLTLLGG